MRIEARSMEQAKEIARGRGWGHVWYSKAHGFCSDSVHDFPFLGWGVEQEIECVLLS